ncbi:MAG: hypothetical protein ISS57_08690 [Anaerolineales bacterium]|nr:hypothetical protein [Anaerolineales bacterium]
MKLHPNLLKIFFVMILTIMTGTLSSCVRETTAPLRVWIDYPREGSVISLGETVTVMSHVYAREGVADVILAVNGEAYRRDAPLEAGINFTEINQEWLPAEAGVYTLQVWVYDTSGESSNPATVSVSVTDEVIAEEVIDAAAEEPITPPTETFTPVVSDTPTLTLVISDTPTLTPTFTATLPPTDTPTLHPPTYTPTFTPTASATPVPVDTTPPPAPVPVVPADGLVVSCRASQTLAWTPVTDPIGINGYYVELEKEITAGSWQNAGAWGPISGKQLDVPVDCGIRYRWVVRAEDGAGNFSDWSSISHFGVNLD